MVNDPHVTLLLNRTACIRAALPPTEYWNEGTLGASRCFAENVFHPPSARLKLRLRLLVCLPVCLWLVLCGWRPAGAQPPDVAEDAAGAWHIVADTVQYDDRSMIYTASGRVVITRGDRRLAAETVFFDQRNMVVAASGNVVLSAGEDVMTADRLRFDLTTETGVIDRGTFFLQKNNFRIRGERIEKLDADTYAALKASVTTCDGEVPAWKITGRRLKVTLEGYGYAWHSVFWIKDVPVLYSPFLAFPVKQKRQSGLLVPEIGYSNRRGFEYQQPLFWAVGDHADATFYWHHMGLRGEKTGAEFRYATGPRSGGILMADYLEDARVDDGVGDSSEKWGYADDAAVKGDPSFDLPRENADRYWLRAKIDQALPAGLMARVDLDTVSDQDYLREFKSGYTGFEFTDDQFSETFGRGVDAFDDPVRLNRLSLERQWSAFSLNIEGRWYDDVVKRLHADEDTTVQRLPSVRLGASKQPIGVTPLFFDFHGEYTFFYREDADTDNRVTQDQRLDLYPRVYLPLKLGPYAVLEPSTGFRETVWRREALDDDQHTEVDAALLYRGLPDVRVDLSSELQRVYRLSQEKPQHRLKHVVKPALSYTFVPEKDQSAYPDFDAVDRIDESQRVRLSVVNRLLMKQGRRPKEAGTAAPPSAADYLDLFRWEIRQDYDVNEAGESDPAERRHPESRRPFLPLFNHLTLTPQEYVHIQADSKWSFYDHRFVSVNTAVALFDKRDDRLFLERRYRTETVDGAYDDIDSIYGALTLALIGPLSVSAAYERDLHADRELLTRFGAFYEAQCWSLDLNYTRDLDEYRYAFVINLKGLGKI